MEHTSDIAYEDFVLIPTELHVRLPEPIVRSLEHVSQRTGASTYHLARLLLGRYLGRRKGVAWVALFETGGMPANNDEDVSYLSSEEGRCVLTISGFRPRFYELLREEMDEFGISEQQWALYVLLRYFSDADCESLGADVTIAFAMPQLATGHGILPGEESS